MKTEYFYICNPGAGLAHRLIYLFRYYAFLKNKNNNFVLNIIWCKTGHVGYVNFDELFTFNDENINILNEENCSEINLNKYKKNINTVFDYNNEIDEFHRNTKDLYYKNLLNNIFKLNIELQQKFIQFYIKNNINKKLGFQIRCSHKPSCNRSNMKSILQYTDSFLIQIKDRQSFFCTDCQNVEQYVIEKIPDICFYTKTYNFIEYNIHFASYDKETIKTAVLEFFTLISCQNLIINPYGGWTQLKYYITPII